MSPMSHPLAEKLAQLGLPITLPKAKIRSRIRSILKDTHPDKTGGEFRDDQQKTKYAIATEVLEILNHHRSSPNSKGNQLQVLTESHVALVNGQAALTKILDERQRQSTAIEEEKAVEASVHNAHTAIARSIHKTYFPFRVGGWSVAAIAVAIALLNQPLGGMLEELFAGDPTLVRLSKILLSVISIGGLCLGLYAKQQQAREIDHLKLITTDAGIQHLLFSYGYYVFGDDVDAEKKVLTRSTLADGIAQFTHIRDRATCETTADAIIAKLLKRGFIELTPIRSLSPTYKADAELIDDLVHGVSFNFEYKSPHKRAFEWLKRLYAKRKKKNVPLKT